MSVGDDYVPNARSVAFATKSEPSDRGFAWNTATPANNADTTAAPQLSISITPTLQRNTNGIPRDTAMRQSVRFVLIQIGLCWFVQTAILKFIILQNVAMVRDLAFQIGALAFVDFVHGTILAHFALGIKSGGTGNCAASSRSQKNTRARRSTRARARRPSISLRMTSQSGHSSRRTASA
jgi:hypothetical protein